MVIQGGVQGLSTMSLMENGQATLTLCRHNTAIWAGHGETGGPGPVHYEFDVKWKGHPDPL